MLSHNNIEEGSVPGATIGTLSTVDQDTTQTHTYSLSDTTYFAISGNSLIISDQQNASSTLLASNSPYSVQVTSTDSGNPAKSYTKTFQIYVTPARPYFMLTFDTGDVSTKLGSTYIPKLGEGNSVTYSIEWSDGEISHYPAENGQVDHIATEGKATGLSHVRVFPNSSSMSAKIFVTNAQSNYNFGHRYRGWDNEYIHLSSPNYLTKVETNDNENWGLTSKCTSLSSAFGNCKILKQLPNYLPASIVDLNSTFNNAFIDLQTDDIPNNFLQWSTENVSNFTGCFKLSSNAGCLSGQDFSGWDVSNATSNGLSGMFYNQSKFQGVGLSNWTFNNAVMMDQMFQSCASLNVSYIQGWDVSKATSFSYMFSGIGSGFNPDLSSWVTSSATSMSNMFQDCPDFNADISGWDVSNVISMNFMFYGCTSFSQNIRGWEVQQGCDLNSMFSGATGMNSRFGSGGADETEYYANTPDIQFFNLKNPPTDIALSGDKQVNENMSVGYVIGSLSATAGDSDVLSFTVNDTTNFEIDGTSLKTKASFDYETKSSYSITITVTDGNSESATNDFTITVVNVNEAPHTMTLSSNTHIAGSDALTSIGDLEVTDPDAGDVITWSVDDSSHFTIEVDSTDSKKATLKNNTVIGTAQTKTITVTATDSGGLNVSNAFSIIIEHEPLYLLLTFDTGDVNTPLGDVYLPKLGTEYSQSNHITYTTEWDFGGEKVTGNQDSHVATEGNAAGKSHVRNIAASSGSIKISEVNSPYNQNIRFGHYGRGWDNNFLSSTAPNYLTVVETNDADNWGLTNNLSELSNAFYNCKKLKEVPSYLPQSVKSLYQTFAFAMYEAKFTDTSGIDRIECNQFLNWTTENVENFGSCFSTKTNNDYLTNEDFQKWNISSCTEHGLSSMFLRQRNFKGTGLDSWALPVAVKNLSQMFRECTSFTGESIKGWDVSNITSFSYTFRDCEAFNADISSWNTSSATSMNYMFTNCTLFNQNIRGWLVQPGCNLSSMFSGATGMNSRFGSGGADETEYYGNTPDIQFFNYTPPTPTTNDITVSIQFKQINDPASNTLQYSEITFYDDLNNAVSVVGHSKPTLNLDGTANSINLERSGNEGAASSYDNNTATKWYSFPLGTITYYLAGEATKYTMTTAGDSGTTSRTASLWETKYKSNPPITENHVGEQYYTVETRESLFTLPPNGGYFPLF
jgi:surface protein